MIVLFVGMVPVCGIGTGKAVDENDFHNMDPLSLKVIMK